MMSVERAISKGIDFTEIIHQFALRKARRQNFMNLFIKALRNGRDMRSGFEIFCTLYIMIECRLLC